MDISGRLPAMGRHSCRLGAISRRGVKKGPANPISLVSADLRWPRGQPPNATPIQSRGPGARARRALPCRYRRPAACHGRQRPGTRRAGQHLAARPVPGIGPGPGCALCASCAGRGSGPDAAQIITAFSRPGELVVIPGARDGVLVAAAAAAGRRVLGLAPGPRSCHGSWRPWAAWTRGCARSPRSGPAARPCSWRPGNPEAGQAALAITGSAAAPGLPW